MRDPALVVGPLGRMLAVTMAADDDAASAARVRALGAVWQRELDALVKHWQDVVAPPRQATLLGQAGHAVTTQSPGALGELQAGDHGGAAAIHLAMQTMAAAGVESVLAEAHAAGLALHAPPPLAAVTLLEWARAASDVLAGGLALAVARETLRQWRPGAVAAEVVDGVRAYLGGLTDRGLRDVLGGALTRAQNLGRLAVYALRPPSGWTLELVADETLDSNTCKPCREIHGTVLPTLDAAQLAYGGAGYLWCEGGERCRGTVVGRWTKTDATRDTAPGVLSPDEQDWLRRMGGRPCLE